MNSGPLKGPLQIADVVVDGDWREIEAPFSVELDEIRRVGKSHQRLRGDRKPRGGSMIVELGIEGEHLWAQFAEKDFGYENYLRLTRKQIPPERYRRLLEIGCGTGIFLERLASCGHSVTGIDVNPDRIKVAHSLHHSQNGAGEFCVSSAGAFQADALYDAALWMNVPIGIQTLSREFLVCATRNVRCGGRILFDYLTAGTEKPSGVSREWTDEIDFPGDSLLSRDRYQRTVWFDYNESPCVVHWLGKRLLSSGPSTVFEFNTSLPTMDKSLVRDTCAQQGWRHIEELGSGQIEIEGDPIGLGFVIDLYEREP